MLPNLAVEATLYRAERCAQSRRGVRGFAHFVVPMLKEGNVIGASYIARRSSHSRTSRLGWCKILPPKR